jgi:hypothetical protein
MSNDSDSFARKCKRMANLRIIEMEILTIIRLHEQGTSLRRISLLTGTHRKTVSQYIAQFKQSGLSLSDLENDEVSVLKALGFKPISKSNSVRQDLFEQFVQGQEDSRKKPGFSIQNMYNDYLQDVVSDRYSRSQFYKQLAQIWHSEQGSIKLNHQFGQQMYVDYTGKKLCYIDRDTGELIPVEVLVTILPASQYLYVEAMANQKQENFINGLMNALEYIDGVPQAIVTDNLKSAVAKTGKYQSTINKTLQGMAHHYETTIDPTRAYHPKDKAMVEGAVKIVYQQIFYQVSKGQYFSIAQINEAIKKELDKLNNKLLTYCDYSRNDQFKKEREFLQPLPVYRYEIKTYQRAKVQKMGYILCSAYKNYYSVPYRYIGKHVEVRHDSRTVEIYYHSNRIALHMTSFNRGNYTTNEEHLSSNNKAFTEWNPEYFSRKAEPHGLHVKQYIELLIAQRPYPEQAYKQAQGILALCKKYTSQRVNVACRMSSGHSHYYYKMIEQILVNQTDIAFLANESTTQEKLVAIPAHENIRGSEYYS